MSALPKMGTATLYPPRQNSPYMKVDNYNDGDDGDDEDDDDDDDDDDGYGDGIENGENGNDDPASVSAELTVYEG